MTGESVLFVDTAFRSMAKRGLIGTVESTAYARKGPLERVSFVEILSVDNRELVVELVDERRLELSCKDVCLNVSLHVIRRKLNMNSILPL